MTNQQMIEAVELMPTELLAAEIVKRHDLAVVVTYRHMIEGKGTDPVRLYSTKPVQNVVPQLMDLADELLDRMEHPE